MVVAACCNGTPVLQPGKEPPHQHRFARATAPGDDHASEAGIHSGQQEGQLGGVMACDGGQGKGLAHHGANTSKGGGAGVAGNHGEGSGGEEL